MARKAKELTTYSRQILDFLRSYHEPIPPTRAEIATALGMHTSTVQHSLLQLQDFGYLTIIKMTSRGIVLTELGKS